MKLGFALLIMVSVFCGSVHAQIPVTDSQNTKSTIKNWFTNLKESKVVVSTMNTAKKTSAAIGTAKKAVSEYVLENKKKIEEKVAKVKEYKEKVEKYKKDYEKYKAQLDEGIAKAKELKEKAEEGIQTAKDTAAAAKDMADAAKETVNGKIGSVSDKLGIGQDNASAESTPSAGTEVSAAEQTSSGVQGNTAAAVQSKPAVASSAVVSTTRRPFGGTGAGVRTSVGSSVAGGVGSVSAALPEADSEAAVTAIMQTDVTAAEMPKKISAKAVAEVAEPVADVETLNGKEIGNAALADVKEVVPVSETVSAKKSVAVKESVGSKAALQSRLKQTDSEEASTFQTIEKTVQPAVDATKRKKLRRTFTTSSLEGGARINASVPVAFAYAAELPDDCSDVNNTRLFPRTVCMYCGLSSSKVKESGTVDECLLDINLESSKAQEYSGRDAPLTYRKGKLEIAAAMIAESYRAANKAETFYDNKVAPIAEAPEGVEQDALANLVEFNKVVDEQLNDLLQLYSSRLALQSYLNYGKYRFKPEDAEDDEE